MNIDELLRDGLIPEFEPGEELDAKIIGQVKAGRSSAPVTPIKKSKASSLTKIVAAACAVVIAGAVGTYAASVIITKPEVIDHGIKLRILVDLRVFRAGTAGDDPADPGIPGRKDPVARVFTDHAVRRVQPQPGGGPQVDVGCRF